MGFDSPKFIDSEGAEAGGGGGPAPGGGNPYKDWTTLPNDPTDGWTITNGVGAVSSGATITKVGDELHFRAPVSANMRIQGSQLKGVLMARSVHLKPWIQAGIQMPVGQSENLFQPEAMTLKIEVEFATSNGGPISGGTVPSADGTQLTCLVGLAGFPTDQSGNPVHSIDLRWSAAQVYKNYGGPPSTQNRLNLYTSGYKSYNTNAGMQGAAQWKNQINGGGPGAHNAIVYATSPLRKETGAGPYGRSNIQAGSYDNTSPFEGTCMANQQMFDHSTAFSMTSGTPFWHIALWFGTHMNNAGYGEIRIKRIRYVLQPIQHRSDL